MKKNKSKKQDNGKYKSKFEKTTADELDKSKISFEYEQLKLKYVVEHTYKPDFQFANKIIIELKGYDKSGWRAKMIRIKKGYPELDIRFYFQNPDLKLSKKSKTSLSQWAEKNGFLWTGDIKQLKKWGKEKPRD